MPADAAPGPSGRRFGVDALLDAARDAFFVDGFALAQVAAIARAAGTTKPTMYARIGTKEQIYLMVVRREADDFGARVSAAYARGEDLSLRALIEVGMAPLFDYARERPAGFHLLFRGDAVNPAVTAARRSVVDGVIEQLAALIRHRQRSPADAGGSPDLVAAACVGLARQICERAMDDAGDIEAAQRLAVRLVDGAIRGLGVGEVQP